jgi:hypothetical protein
LAGYGLRASGSQLDQNLLTQNFSVGPSTPSIGLGQRATVQRSPLGAGSVAWPVADATTLTNGWFCYILNEGTGSVTLTPYSGQTIDGNPNKVLGPGESCTLLSDGFNLETLAYSRGPGAPVAAMNIDVPGSGDYTLTTGSSSQAAAQVQNFTGTLTGPRNIIYPASAGYWFIWNETTGSGPNNPTFKIVGDLGPGVAIPQNSFAIIRSDGARMNLAYSGALAGTVTSVAAGTGLTTDQSAGGPITTTGTIRIATISPTLGNTYGAGPTPGPASYPIVQLNNQGQVIAASSQALGTASFANTGTAPGNVPALQSPGYGANGLLAAAQGGASTGDLKASIAAGITGWVLCVGGVGSAASNASQRANADCQDLFMLVWNRLDSTRAPLYDSAGNPVARGADALTDWNANRSIALPDMRGRTIYGLDNMAFGNANRLTPGFGATATIMGAASGQSTMQPRVFGNVDTSGSIYVQTASFGIGGTTAGASSFLYNVSTAGGSTAAEEHTHSWGQSGIILGSSGNNSMAGGIRNDGNNLTASFATVPPGAVFNIFIKL